MTPAQKAEQRREQIGLTDFGALYDERFLDPQYRPLELHNEWLLAEEWLAGPLTTLREQGNLDYVFAGRNARLGTKIKTIDDFRAWAEAQLTDGQRALLSKPGLDPRFIELLKRRVDILLAIIDAACRFLARTG